MLFGWPWPPRRSTPSAPPRPRCRRRRPESRRPSGHRHSGSGSRCRLLLDPEGDGSFEQITLHPQPSVLALQLPQPRLLVSRQPVLLATVDAVLANPVPQGRVVDTKLTGDLGDRPAAATDQLHRVAFELGSELAPVPWLSVFHGDILRSREVSCLRGEVQLRRSSLSSSTVSARPGTPSTPISVLASNDARASSHRRSKAGRTAMALALPVMIETMPPAAAHWHSWLTTGSGCSRYPSTP